MPDINPADFLELAYKDYLRATFKYVRKLAAKRQKHDFFVTHGYRMGTVKRTLFLLASDTDARWKPVLARLSLKPAKCVQGSCRIREHEDKVLIVIKSVVGALNLDASVALLKEELFPEDEGFSVMTQREWAALKQ